MRIGAVQQLLRAYELSLFKKNIVIGKKAQIHKRCTVDVDDDAELVIGKCFSWGENGHIGVVGNGVIEIGDYVFFNRNLTIVSRGHISIGNESIFGPNVCVYDHDHCFGYGGYSEGYKVDSVKIGNHCWIGANVTILRGTEVGDNCVLGAGTIISGKIPSNSIVRRAPSNSIVVEEIKVK